MMFLYAGITAGIAAADIVIKKWIEQHIPRGSQRTILRKFYIRNVRNRGLALNRLQDHPTFIKGGSVAALVGVGIYQVLTLLKPDRFPGRLGIALITGGAISNTLDRVKKGYVVDYAAVETANEKVTDITFNLGDIAILGGAVISVIEAIKSGS